jgi:pyruvate kinase
VSANPQSFFPAMTKIVGTLGPKSRSVDTISACLKAGMSVARFDFSWGDAAYHQDTLENLKLAIKSTKRLCAVSRHSLATLVCTMWLAPCPAGHA